MRKITTALLAGVLSVSLAACGGSASSTSTSTDSENVTVSADGLLNDGVFTISMECAYAPYNWAQTDDSNGAVPIDGTNEYANGYDVMIAKKIAEANGWDLKIIRSDWDSLVPAVQTGKIDAAIAGQSMTADRREEVDFAGPYYYASFAILVKSDSDLTSAKSINDFSGKTGTAQESEVRSNHALYISYAPFEAPEVSVTCVIPNGYSSGNARELAGFIYAYMYDPDKLSTYEMTGNTVVLD